MQFTYIWVDLLYVLHIGLKRVAIIMFLFVRTYVIYLLEHMSLLYVIG